MIDRPDTPHADVLLEGIWEDEVTPDDLASRALSAAQASSYAFRVASEGTTATAQLGEVDVAEFLESETGRWAQSFIGIVRVGESLVHVSHALGELARSLQQVNLEQSEIVYQVEAEIEAAQRQSAQAGVDPTGRIAELIAVARARAAEVAERMGTPETASARKKPTGLVSGFMAFGRVPGASIEAVERNGRVARNGHARNGYAIRNTRADQGAQDTVNGSGEPNGNAAGNGRTATNGRGAIDPVIAERTSEAADAPAEKAPVEKDAAAAAHDAFANSGDDAAMDAGFMAFGRTPSNSVPGAAVPAEAHRPAPERETVSRPESVPEADDAAAEPTPAHSDAAPAEDSPAPANGFLGMGRAPSATADDAAVPVVPQPLLNGFMSFGRTPGDTAPAAQAPSSGPIPVAPPTRFIPIPPAPVTDDDAVDATGGRADAGTPMPLAGIVGDAPWSEPGPPSETPNEGFLAFGRVPGFGPGGAGAVPTVPPAPEPRWDEEELEDGGFLDDDLLDEDLILDEDPLDEDPLDEDLADEDRGYELSGEPERDTTVLDAVDDPETDEVVDIDEIALDDTADDLLDEPVEADVDFADEADLGAEPAVADVIEPALIDEAPRDEVPAEGPVETAAAEVAAAAEGRDDESLDVDADFADDIEPEEAEVSAQDVLDDAPGEDVIAVPTQSEHTLDEVDRDEPIDAESEADTEDADEIDAADADSDADSAEVDEGDEDLAPAEDADDQAVDDAGADDADADDADADENTAEAADAEDEADGDPTASGDEPEAEPEADDEAEPEAEADDEPEPEAEPDDEAADAPAQDESAQDEPAEDVAEAKPVTPRPTPRTSTPTAVKFSDLLKAASANKVDPAHIAPAALVSARFVGVPAVPDAATDAAETAAPTAHPEPAPAPPKPAKPAPVLATGPAILGRTEPLVLPKRMSPTLRQVHDAVASILGSLRGGPHGPQSGLHWAAGLLVKDAETIMAVTTSDAGWLPPGVLIPAGVRVLWNMPSGYRWASIDDPVRQLIEYAEQDGYTLTAVATTHPSRVYAPAVGEENIVGVLRPGAVLPGGRSRFEATVSPARLQHIRSLTREQAERQARALIRDLETQPIAPEHAIGIEAARIDARCFLDDGAQVPRPVLDQLLSDERALGDALSLDRTPASPEDLNGAAPEAERLRDRMLERAILVATLGAAYHDIESAVYAWTFARFLSSKDQDADRAR